MLSVWQCVSSKEFPFVLRTIQLVQDNDSQGHNMVFDRSLIEET